MFIGNSRSNNDPSLIEEVKFLGIIMLLPAIFKTLLITLVHEAANLLLLFLLGTVPASYLSKYSPLRILHGFASPQTYPNSE